MCNKSAQTRYLLPNQLVSATKKDKQRNKDTLESIRGAFYNKTARRA